MSDILKSTTRYSIETTLLILNDFTESLENSTERKSFNKHIKSLPNEQQAIVLRDWHFYPHLIQVPNGMESHQDFISKKWYQTLQQILDTLNHSKKVTNKTWEWDLEPRHKSMDIANADLIEKYWFESIVSDTSNENLESLKQIEDMLREKLTKREEVAV